ncbi:MAG: formate dehydrogenase accessory sulfurtransferase FdhD [bacterium]
MISDVEIIKYSQGWEKVRSQVVTEDSLTIYLNGKQIVTLMCTSNSKEFLAIGFLAVERLIDPDNAEEIQIMELQDEAIYIEAPYSKKAPGGDHKTITPGLGKGITFSEGDKRLESIKISSSISISPPRVFHLMKELTERSTLYKMTHGVHNAGICTQDELEIFQYDLGRHNAVDKLYGQCLLEKVPLSERIIITSGRVSSEILTKVGLMGIPILISRSSPTDKSVRLADRIGLTLIAGVRGDKMSVYTHPERVLGLCQKDL